MLQRIEINRTENYIAHLINCWQNVIDSNRCLMMYKRKGFTLIELLVVIAIIALLMAILMPALKRIRDQSETVGCLSNLRQWGIIFEIYAQDNEGRFWGTAGPQSWVSHIHIFSPKYIDIVNKIWFCPTAKRLQFENGVGRPFSIFNAWHDANTAGSYGINGYVCTYSPPFDFIKFYGRGVPTKDGWETSNVPGANNIPLLVDALDYYLLPLANDPPSRKEGVGFIDSITGCCINRHDGYVGCLFLDYSVRKVGLKELWTLKWHRSFDTKGPWTTSGGVKPTDWPEWMAKFKNY
jgi:prepilin-type N-terminal cleavage/methylation domain-containing protein